jgi:hypothetical protein
VTKTPNFTDPQFIDSAGLGGFNHAFGLVNATTDLLTAALAPAPGLVSPEVCSVTTAGNVATVTMPAPFGIIGSGGVFAMAHGTVTGQDTQTATVNFTPLVPASGSVTAYCNASLTQIQQDSFPIPGPPPGHPNWDPNYIPTVGYATVVDTIQLAASTNIGDGFSTFSLFSTVLTAGQANLGTLNAGSQKRAGGIKTWPTTVITGSYGVSPAQAPTLLRQGPAGITTTLPPSQNSGGCVMVFEATEVGGWLIVANSGDAIYGTAGVGGSGGGPVSSVTLGQGQTMMAVADGGTSWFVLAMSPGFPLGGVLTGTLPNPGMAAGAAVENIGFTPVQQGGGNGQLGNKVYVGWDGTGTRITIDVTDQGQIWMANKALGGVLTGTAADAGLDNTGVASGFYPYASVTVGADGRLTYAQTNQAVGGVLTGNLPDPGLNNTGTSTGYFQWPALSIGADGRIYGVAGNATPALLSQFYLDPGVDGYAQFPCSSDYSNGLIVQWGTWVAYDGAPAQIGVTFPVTFPNGVFGGWACMYDNTTAIGGIATYNLTTYSMDVAQSFSGGQTGAYSFYWLALGY